MPKLPDARQATCWQKPFPPTNKPARSVARRNDGVCRLYLVVAWDVYFGQLAAQDRYAASVADIDRRSTSLCVILASANDLGAAGGKAGPL